MKHFVEKKKPHGTVRAAFGITEGHVMRIPKMSALLGSTHTVRLDAAIEGLSQLAMHEAASMDRIADALRERVMVARKARGVGELLRNQLDLLPATTARLAKDHSVRVQLLKRLRDRITAPSANAAA